MVNKAEVKRVFFEILIMAIILGTVVGVWFINKIGPWQDLRDIKEPYLSWTDDTATTMTISFQTPENVSTIIQYGLNHNYTNFTTTTNTKWHSVTLTNLQPSSLYYYRISSSDYNYSYMNVDYHFTTASRTGPIRFVVYGDHRPGVFGRGQHEVVIKTFLDYHPDFVLDVGDIVSDATGNANGQWDRLFYEWRNLAPYTPIMISMGNHEFYEGSGAIDCGAYYLQTFHFPGSELYYSFNYSNAHFISLNLSCDEHRVLPGSPEYNWLINDLSIANSSPEIDWIFVFYHVPLYSSGGHGDNDNLIHDLQHIFDSSSVDLVLQGHDHHYERLQIANLTYLILGGGGAEGELYLGDNPYSQRKEIGNSFWVFDINGLTLTVQIIRTDGYIIDTLIMTK
jgi:hypothetical protein